MNHSTIHANYIASDLKGTPKPDMVDLIKQIRTDNPSIGANGAMQRATEMVRAWAVANGYAQ